MRSLPAVVILLAAAAAVAACGGQNPIGPKANSKVYFTIDAATCTGTSPVQFSVDSAIVGTETLSAGQTSQGYQTTGGVHVLGARLANGTFIWPNTTVSVPFDASYTRLLPCG